MAKRPEVKSDEHLSKMEFRTNVRPSSIKVPDTYQEIQWERDIENRKSSTRCKVEHPFLIVKRQFGYARVAYRGLAKNFHRFNVLFASANMIMCARAGRLREGVLRGVVRPKGEEVSRKSDLTGQYNCHFSEISGL